MFPKIEGLGFHIKVSRLCVWVSHLADHSMRIGGELDEERDEGRD